MAEPRELKFKYANISVRKPSVPLSNYPIEFVQILRSLSKQGRSARADRGVPLIRQLIDLLSLRACSGKLRADDYYNLRLYREGISFAEKRQYASNQALPKTLVGRWSIVAADKLLTYSILSSFGIAIPKIHAVCHDSREYRDSTTLKTISDVSNYLRGSAPYPLIAQPVMGSWSKDVYLLKRFDAPTDSVILEGEVTHSVLGLAKHFLSTGSGYLIQELLHPHQDIRRVISDKICTLRVIILLERKCSHLFMAKWKINAGTSAADNYWREGNLLAKLDQESGEILQCMTGLGPKYRVVDRHPKSGELLAGFRVPEYRETISLALRASKSFPGMPMQAWDIAITDRGPIPLELNFPGSLLIPQLVSQKGIWRSHFRDFVTTARG